MFEGSLVESRGMVVSSTQRWTALGSLTLQVTIAGLLLTIPLVRPQMLPLIPTAPRLEFQVPVRPPVPVQIHTSSAGPATSLSVPVMAPQAEATQRLVFPRPGESNIGPAPAFDPNLKMGTGGPGGGTGIGMIGAPESPAVAVARPQAKAGPVPVSGGVTAGMLLTPIQPVYPAIAKATGTQGTVVMEAVISKTGRIESLHVVSGPALLQRAAQDAVLAARYRPYLLSGVPTEVQTTISVVFKIGG